MAIWKVALETRKLGIRSYSECGVVGGRPRTAENKEAEEGKLGALYDLCTAAEYGRIHSLCFIRGSLLETVATL